MDPPLIPKSQGRLPRPPAKEGKVCSWRDRDERPVLMRERRRSRQEEPRKGTQEKDDRETTEMRKER